jgi:uncharacterized repeat protein (TIGR03803 family)
MLFQQSTSRVPLPTLMLFGAMLVLAGCSGAKSMSLTAPMSDGTSPSGSLIQGVDGNFYGTTQFGGNSNNGTVFRISTSGKETVLYAFQGGTTDGATPGPLTPGPDGNFYGTTSSGGIMACQGSTAAGGTPSNSNPVGCGTVFRVTPQGAETVLYEFGSEGDLPTGVPLTVGADGALYGTTGSRVYRITPSGMESTLYTFSASSTTLFPGPVIEGTDGNLYGITSNGGTSGWGTIFRLTPQGQMTILYSFQGGQNGASPDAPFLQNSAGMLFGIVYQGGDTSCGEVGCGAVFSATTSGEESTVYAFTASASDGFGPTALVYTDDGNLYGTSSGGGPINVNNGLVYKLTPSGEETLLYAFTGPPADGAGPNSLVQGVDGNFYGTTQIGGEQGSGTVFMVTPSGKESLLHSFGAGQP